MRRGHWASSVVGEAVPSQHHYSANSHRIAIALLVQDGDRNAVTVNERKINSGKRYTQASRMKVPAKLDGHMKA